MTPSLYLHLPFCNASCAYCAFYSEPKIHWKEEWPAYVARMEREIRQAKEAYGSFDTIFLGGGNPLSLPVAAIRTLLKAAGPSRETSLETNPETLTDTYEPLFQEGLVGRVSMGIQSLDETTLRTLGRASTKRQTLEGVERLGKLRDKYSLCVNFDLICCVPGQSIDASRRDIDQLLSLIEPDHLSLYCLALEPGTALEKRVRKGLVRMVGESSQADCLFSLWDYLREKGYEHYEVSNFARNGFYCLHNLHYWHLDPYVGIGSHAAGRILRSGGGLDATENDQDLHQYARGPLASGYQVEHLGWKEEVEEYLLTGLRLVWGIDKETFRLRFSRDFDALFSRQIAEMDQAYYTDDGRHFSLTEKGMMVLDSILLSLVQML